MILAGAWGDRSGTPRPVDRWDRRENNRAVLEQSAIPPPYALLWEVRLRKPCGARSCERSYCEGAIGAANGAFLVDLVDLVGEA